MNITRSILTLLRSSAASSFFMMSSRETSLFGGLVMQWEPSDTGEVGFRMTSKAWPEARLLMVLMSRSVMCDRKKTTSGECCCCFTTLCHFDAMLEEQFAGLTFKVPHEVFPALWVEAGADEREDRDLLHLLFVSWRGKTHTQR